MWKFGASGDPVNANFWNSIHANSEAIHWSSYSNEVIVLWVKWPKLGEDGIGQMPSQGQLETN